MPSSYTSNNGLELMATGENSGTWGDKTNTSLSIIDRVTTGVGEISLSGTTHTLTTTDATLSDGHYRVLVFGGSPSGTNTVTITPNDQEKYYIVKNNSGQSVVMTQGSGGNVTIANGKSAIVYADGTGAGAAVVDVTATFNFQAASAALSAIAALATTDGNIIVGDGSTWVAESGSTARASLGLAIGTNVQAYDPALQSISGLTTSADQMIYTTASDTYATTSLTAAGRAILDDADASAQRTTLGLGTIATQNANNVSITGGSITGITDLAVSDGGTGASSFTANNVLLGNGSSAFQVVAPGTSGNVLTSNGTTWVSQAAAPSAGVLQATATGSLSDGTKVIINTDGTVSAVGLSNLDPLSDGTPVVFAATDTAGFSGERVFATFDSASNKVVIVYTNVTNSNYGTAVVGTVSGNTISFGTPVVFESAATYLACATFNSNSGKVVVAYQDSGNSSYGTAIVGTVSGTSISFGTAAVFESASTSDIAITSNGTASTVTIAYSDTGNSSYGTAIVGTVSGTSISFGSAVVFESAQTQLVSSDFDTTSSKVVIAYSGASFAGKAVVGTVTGGSISFGTPVSFAGGGIGNGTSTGYDANADRTVIAYGGASNHGTAIVGTVSGTSISFGTAVVFESAASSRFSVRYASNLQKVAIAYTPVSFGSGAAKVVLGTVNNTAISYGTAKTFTGAVAVNLSMTFDSDSDVFVAAYSDSGSSDNGKAVVLETQGTNLTAENFIGISNGAYTNAQTATIQIVGSVDDAQSGLTAGQAYYVQGDGSLSTTPATPSVFAGTAVSATKIIVKG